MDKVKVIVLNGPPQCGKDTIGKELVKSIDKAIQGEFKGLLLKILKQTLNLSDDTFDMMYANRELKDVKQPFFNGKSIRDMMISISEDYIKPMLGQDYIGKYELTKIKRGDASCIVYTDGGFYDEIRPLLEDDSIELHVIQIHRVGCSFSGDSRGWLIGDGIDPLCIANNGTVQKAVELIRAHINI